MTATRKQALVSTGAKARAGSSRHSREELYATGKALCGKCPRNAQADWKVPANRHEPVDPVLQAEKGRIPELLSLRHGRIVRSPFSFSAGGPHDGI